MDRIIEKKKWTSKKIASLVGVGLFVLFILYLLFFRDTQSRLYVEKEQLTITEVRKDKFQEFIPVDGVVFPKNTVYIDAIQGGFVEAVYVEDGAILQKGDTILKLLNDNMVLSYMDQETRMYDAINNLQNTQVNLERTRFLRQKEIVQLEYQIDAAAKNFDRKQQLYSEKVISDMEFEDAQRDYNFNVRQLNISLEMARLDSVSMISQSRQIDMSVARMENNLSLLKRNLDNLYVKAPIAGKLSSFQAELGETKGAGEHLGQIDMMDGFKLRANIDERYVSRVFIGQEAEFDFAGKTYRLHVSKIFTDVTNGSFQVDMLFNDIQPGNIKRGQTVQMRLEFSRPSDAIIVKRGGFFQETGGNWIYILDASGEYALKREIRIGNQNTTYYEVLAGLEPGDRVIISSYDNFGNKDKLIFR